MNYVDRLLKIRLEIGNTPLLKLVFKINGKEKTVFAKEEFLNPSNSIKIRPAYQILFDAINKGELKEHQRVVEVTSGNMGISLAYLCKKIGNPITILMPKTMSKERQKILKDLGAEIVLTEDFIDAFNKINQFKKEGAYLPQQFENNSNTISHRGTAKEIIQKTDDFEAFLSGVGTGGTLIGCGGFLKEKYSKKVIAIDPKESKLLLKGKSEGKHKIQGLSDQIIPLIYDKNVVDEIIEISSDDAIVMARKIKENFGIGVGISSGANTLGALLSEYSKVATVFADDDSKYKSTDLYNLEITSKIVDEIEFISCEIL